MMLHCFICMTWIEVNYAAHAGITKLYSDNTPKPYFKTYFYRIYYYFFIYVVVVVIFLKYVVVICAFCCHYLKLFRWSLNRVIFLL